MKSRFIFVHGNQTTHWSGAWAGWLKSELEKLGHETFFETMPDSIIARAEYWLPFLKDHVKAGENDIIIGWSSGAVAAMRYAETNRIRGSILVSPCYTDTGDELEKQSGYYDSPWRWEAIKSNQQDIALIYGDDDPYISQAEFEFIAQQLNPSQIKVAGGKHFIERTEFPELLQYIRQTYVESELR
jgi:predicted alpha/beta hydrolase family esterase